MRTLIVVPLCTAALMENLPTDVHKTDAQVIVHMSARAPAQELRRHRVALFVRIALHAPPGLLALLFAVRDEPKSWAYAVLRDLERIWTYDDELQSLPSPLEHPGCWLAESRQHPKSFKAHLYKALARAPRESAAPRDQGDFAEHRCQNCSRVFPRRDMMLSHAARVHGYRNPAATRVAGTVCASCGTDFHSTARLYKHVSNRSHRCLQFYVSSMPELDAQQLVAGNVRVAPEDASKALLKPALRK